jgi:hypothetical protein
MSDYAIIFAGPSLPRQTRPDDPSIIWLPPIKQGELQRAAFERPAIIGVVDGYFEITPTVWHKEILWAMSQGIHVYGGASLGALRAAELYGFGMIGVGRIFAAYRDGVLCDDDEVAVLHGPEELGYPTVTEAMVNIRATLDKAVAAGVQDSWCVPRLTEAGKGLFYKERTWEALLERAAGGSIPPLGLDEFAAWLPQNKVDQKRIDAQMVVAAIREHLRAGVRPLRVSYQFQHTGFHEVALRQLGKTGEGAYQFFDLPTARER